jgi:hypothetical protein
MITLQFVAESNIASWAIRYWTAGPYSHVDTVLPDGRLLGARSDTVGGAPPGVQIRTPGYAPFSHIVQVELPATPEEEVAFHNFEVEQLGKPYDSSAIWGFATDRDWRTPDSWFCSEEKLAGLETAAWCPRLDIPANKVSPVALYLIVTARGGVPWTIL